MGVSTDGKLFYGIHFEEGELEELDFGYSDDEQSSCGSQLEAHIENEYCHKNPPPVQFGTHCSYDYPIYYLCITSTDVTASRGDPKKIDTLEVNPEWDKMLKQYCDKYKIPFTKPGWYLASMWG